MVEYGVHITLADERPTSSVTTGTRTSELGIGDSLGIAGVSTFEPNARIDPVDPTIEGLDEFFRRELTSAYRVRGATHRIV